MKLSLVRDRDFLYYYSERGSGKAVAFPVQECLMRSEPVSLRLAGSGETGSSPLNYSSLTVLAPFSLQVILPTHTFSQDQKVLEVYGPVDVQVKSPSNPASLPAPERPAKAEILELHCPSPLKSADRRSASNERRKTRRHLRYKGRQSMDQLQYRTEIIFVAKPSSPANARISTAIMPRRSSPRKDCWNSWDQLLWRQMKASDNAIAKRINECHRWLPESYCLYLHS